MVSASCGSSLRSSLGNLDICGLAGYPAPRLRAMGHSWTSNTVSLPPFDGDLHQSKHVLCCFSNDIALVPKMMEKSPGLGHLAGGSNCFNVTTALASP